MSLTDVSTSPDVAPPRRATPRTGAGFARWARVALACAVLLASGAVRGWQAGRIGAVLDRGRVPPFPLKELPMTLGTWQGEAVTLDPEIARGAGATDMITRRYVDQRTGSVIDAIVLYGPSGELNNHVPEVCYPGSGFEQVEGPDERTVVTGPIRAPFRSLVFKKGEGGQADVREVYYSWRYSGHWSLQLGTYKKFERIPGMFKVQLDRKASERERRDLGNPCEAFLEVLIPELERRAAGRPREESPR